MKFDMQKIKLGAGVLAAVAVVGAGSYWYAASAFSPPIVTISQTACGVPATTASFGVPLATVAQSAPRVPVSFGPIEAPQAGGAVNLKFDAGVDGRAREVTMLGDTLLLPVNFGRDDAYPERITITCRDGAVATVRYQGSSRAGATFNVVHQQLAEAPANETTTVVD